MVTDDSQLVTRIARRAEQCGIDLTPDGARAVAAHMRRVLDADPSLHLTSIVDPDEFLERHVGESLEGAALLARGVAGNLLDLGSGNGYPGLPIAACHRGLRPYLAESSRRKVEFLASVIDALFPRGQLIDRQIQRADDLDAGLRFEVVVTRAMGNWERVLPRLVRRMNSDGRLLVWAGAQMEGVAARAAWRKFRLLERKSLPGRERSWVWMFGPAGPGGR